jgi:hypothetical protein
MKQSKYDQVSGVESEAPKNDRYGFSEKGWKELTTEQRETHYNRLRPCEHKYEYQGIETAPGVFDKSDERLRWQYSFDPYFHTAHLLPHSVELFFKGECKCQTCAGKFGIERTRGL